jgi:hypothetical protein
MRHIREINGGRDYDPEWSRAKTPRSVFANLIRQRFDNATKRIGLSSDAPKLDPALFRRPAEKTAQLTLF